MHVPLAVAIYWRPPSASLQQFLWCSIVERLEHLVLSVYCRRSCCLLSPEDKCKLIEWPGQGPPNDMYTT